MPRLDVYVVTVLFLSVILLGYGLTVTSFNETRDRERPDEGLLNESNSSSTGAEENDTETETSYETGNDDEDPPEMFVGGSGDVLRVNESGFNYVRMELKAGDSLRVRNGDERSHNLVIENMDFEREIQSGSETSISIDQGGEYILRSDKFDEEYVSLDINSG